MLKRRSRRLRKKLHVGEFQEMGVEVKIIIDIEQLDFDSAIDKLIEYIEEDDCSFCGGGDMDGNVISGIMYRSNRGTITPSDKESFKTWLSNQSWIKGFSMSRLVDMWHTPLSDEGSFS
jgi:uncharacterized protein YggL (DUF469 family)